jgi:hypothetical protein
MTDKTGSLILELMKLIAEGEEEEQDDQSTPADLKKKLQELFKKADGDGSLQPYIKDEIIQVKSADINEPVHVTFPGEPNRTINPREGDFVLRTEEDPNKLMVINQKDLDAKYEVQDVNAEPDGEGYLNYRPKGQVLAFEYTEHEPLELKDSRGKLFHVKYGDYLGYPIDDSTTLIQMDKNHFEKRYRLA